jgi:phosphatidylglycerophosphatase A
MNSKPAAIHPESVPSKGWVTFHYTVATWFGCGFAPFAPGTFGSLGAIPLVVALGSLDNRFASVLTLVALCILGARSAHVVAQVRGDDDPSLVVIDEVVGVLVAWLWVAHGPIWIQALAWLLFRLLDITKPGPIATLEHTRPIGVGIMLDDLLAGFLAGFTALALQLVCANWL